MGSVKTIHDPKHGHTISRDPLRDGIQNFYGKYLHIYVTKKYTKNWSTSSGYPIPKASKNGGIRPFDEKCREKQ